MFSELFHSTPFWLGLLAGHLLTSFIYVAAFRRFTQR
jgi:hypothetical protein